MEVKKSPKADLEGKKSTWLLIGYVFILALMFVAFEWTERDKQVTTDTGMAAVVFEEQQQAPPPEVPKAEEIIEIVENDAKVEETVIQASDDTEKAVEVKYTPVVVEEEELEEQQIFQIVEEMPEFPGGMGECLKFLMKNAKYPTISQENGVQGKVSVKFVIEKDGSIADPVVVRGVDPYLDKEALRVVKSMPKWKPGKQRGKPVRVSYTVPVIFKLQ